MSKSILQPNDKCCFITGSVINLDKHHVYGNIANRKLSEIHGCWVWLRHDIHKSVHDKDKDLDKYLKQICQIEFEKTHTREEFRKIFGKSYL